MSCHREPRPPPASRLRRFLCRLTRGGGHKIRRSRESIASQAASENGTCLPRRRRMSVASLLRHVSQDGAEGPRRRTISEFSLCGTRNRRHVLRNGSSVSTHSFCVFQCPRSAASCDTMTCNGETKTSVTAARSSSVQNSIRRRRNRIITNIRAFANSSKKETNY